MAGIKATGKLNRKTVSMMSMPRCGVEDTMGSFMMGSNGEKEYPVAFSPSFLVNSRLYLHLTSRQQEIMPTPNLQLKIDEENAETERTRKEKADQRDTRWKVMARNQCKNIYKLC